MRVIRYRNKGVTCICRRLHSLVLKPIFVSVFCMMLCSCRHDHHEIMEIITDEDVENITEWGDPTFKISYDVSYDDAGKEQDQTRANTLIETTYIPQGEVLGIYGVMTTSAPALDNSHYVPEFPYTWSINMLNTNFINEPYVSPGEKGYLYSENGAHAKYEKVHSLYLFAYYPYTASDIIYNPHLADPVAPQLPIHVNQNMEHTPDYLFGSVGGVWGQDDVLKLGMRHALSRVKVKIFTNNESYTSDFCPKVRRVIIETNDPQDGWMNIASGNIKRNDLSSNKHFEYDLTESPYLIYSGKSEDEIDTNADFLFLPSSNAFSKISFEVEDEMGGVNTYTPYSYLPSANDPKKIYSGHIHTIVVEYNVRSTLGCSIIGWEDNGTNNIVDVIHPD